MPAEHSGAAPAARPLTRSDLKTLSLSALGGALEFYDFIIFVFFAAVLGKLFFPAEMPEWLRQLQTFGIFAAGYLARPLGGIVMAHFGDLLGRKRMFTLSIFMMAVPTLCMGLLPTYAQIGIWAPLALLSLRVVQGAAIGGEVPGAWVFVSEHVPERRIGFACSTLTAGLTAGILLGSLTASAINRAFSPAELADWAWRIPFLLGGVFGLLSVYLRRWLHETPVFAELQLRQSLAAELPLKAVLREHRPAVLLSMLLTWVLSAGIVVVILMTPTLLQTQHGFAAGEALAANSLAIVGLTFGCVLAGLSADRFGAGPTFVCGGLLLLLSSSAFYASLAEHRDLLLPLYALAGLCVGTIGAIPMVMVKAFPAVVRFSGLSFSYNLAYAICGGLTPILVSLLLKWSPLGPAYYVGALCLLLVLAGAALWRRTALAPAPAA
ncbi:MFS transporter [Azotobacter chroococcum]|uniref:MFS transporter n=1 Tax=Azotobacter chroococcum TaxID=353 RepID=UPI00103A0E2B|nr:MFS transporter [Azotobacter chroococcum]TBW36678.1 MFS transporter [Azotobacter chroococcum]